MIKLIIAGGRDFIDYNFVKGKLDNIMRFVKEPIEIVSGRCSSGKHTFTTDEGIKVYGVDGLGERYAKEHGYPVKPFPADWGKGKGAGPLRNTDMAEYGTHGVFFWDGVSKGTADMITKAKKRNLITRIVYISTAESNTDK